MIEANNLLDVFDVVSEDGHLSFHQLVNTVKVLQQDESEH